MRAAGWQERLQAVIDRHATAPFVWGRSDCSTLALDAIEALLGQRPELEIPAYRDQEGATRALAKLGFKSLQEAFENRFEEVVPAFARRGDIGLVEDAGTIGCAVVLGEKAAVKHARGLMLISRLRLVRAWSIA